MIGDGMGPAQVQLLNDFIAHSRTNKRLKQKDAFKRISKLGFFGNSDTKGDGFLAVDSAGSATQLASGEKSLPGLVGYNSRGRKIKSILVKAKEKGLSTGLVSDTRISHATPAAFITHHINRSNEAEVAEGILKGGADVLMSGGLKFFLPKDSVYDPKVFETKSARKDDKDLLDDARMKNYQVIHSKDDFKTLDPDKKVLGLFADAGMKNAIWYSNNLKTEKRKTPTLREMTELALNRLNKNPKGFFLMVEGGQIDWAGHRNDAATLLHEMIRFNETLNLLIDFVEKNPETLLVVTGDHETGGFATGYNTNDIPKGRMIPGGVFEIKKYNAHIDYGYWKVLDRLYSQKISLYEIWAKYKETGKNDTKTLGKVIREATGITLSKSKLEEILKDEPNPKYIKDHKALSVKSFPAIGDKREYYMSQSATRLALMGRALAPKYNVIWGTGGHTSTPVNVYSLGPQHAAEMFKGMNTHPEIGKKLQKAFGF